MGDPKQVTMADSSDTRRKKDEYYMPRKCSVTNRLLGSKDHASVQLNIGHVDKFGIYEEKYTVYCLSGAVRRRGEGDFGLNQLCVDSGLMNARAEISVYLSLLRPGD